MLEHFLSAPYVIFSSAIFIVAVITAMEAIGFGLSAFDVDLPFDNDADADGGFLDFLGIGHVPLLMIILSVLTLFGASGMLVQDISHKLSGSYLPVWIAVATAVGFTLPLTGVTARLLAKIIPQTETTAISVDGLLGKRAIIQHGTAQPGNPVTARIVDHHGQTHQILVETQDGAATEGEEVILVRREGHTFVGVLPFENTFPKA